MAQRPTPGESGWRFLRGSIEGALAAAALVLLLHLLAGGAFQLGTYLADAGRAALAGALVLGWARYRARGIVGAIAGLALGFGLGWFFGLAAAGGGATNHTGEEVQIAGPTLDGKTLDVRELRGQVVLVDFWATWCPPCRAAIPELRELHRRYHEHGFEIVGVSLDFQRSALERSVKENELPWPQIYFDRKGQQDAANPLARRLGVESIPYTLLIDREGKVVATGLHGRALASAVGAVVEGRPASPLALLPTGARFLLVVGCLAGWLLGVRIEQRIREGSHPAPAGGKPA
jgi:thiol-disulfide isomerase/thioredoxin